MEAIVVVFVVLAWMWTERHSWWGVSHHAAQVLGDSTILAMPAAALIGAVGAFRHGNPAIDCLAESGAKPMLIVRARQASTAAVSSLAGAAVSTILVTGWTLLQGAAFGPNLLHLVAFVVSVGAASVFGFAVVTVFRTPGAAVAAAVVALVIPRASAFIGDGGLSRAFVADEVVLGTASKSSSYLLAQIAVMAAFAAACMAFALRNWSSSIVWLALAAGFAVMASNSPTLELEPTFATTRCTEVEQTRLCVAAIHAPLLDEYAEWLRTPLAISNEVRRVDLLIEDGSILPASTRPDFNIVIFSGRRGFDDQVDLPARDETLSPLLPLLLGIERCPPVIIPEDFEQPEPGEELIFDASPQGEVFQWYLTELSAQGTELAGVHPYMDGEFRPTGLAVALSRLNQDSRQRWFDTNEAALSNCSDVVTGAS